MYESGRLRYEVNADKKVIRYDYDENHNQVQQCEFKERIVDIESYDQLREQLKKLTPDESKDSITKTNLMPLIMSKQ